MGLFQAVSGAIGGTLADQWLDFYTVPDGLPATAAVFPAVRRDENAGRGENAGASDGSSPTAPRSSCPRATAWC